MTLTYKQRKQAYRVLLGEQLVRAREAKGMSQQEVADATGISRVSVSHYERGMRAINTEDLIMYCETCGFNTGEIMEHIRTASTAELERAYAVYWERITSLK